MRLITLALLMMVAGLASAASVTYYRCATESGEVVMSDRPCGEEAESRQVQFQRGEVPPPPAETAEGDTQPPAEGEQAAAEGEEGEPVNPYNNIAISSPRNGEVVRSPGGDVSVAVTLSPPLQQGHSIQITVDGKQAAKTSSTRAVVSGLAKGRRTLQASVLDAKGEAVTNSSAIRFILF